jgi:hypothetical protein
MYYIKIKMGLMDTDKHPQYLYRMGTQQDKKREKYHMLDPTCQKGKRIQVVSMATATRKIIIWIVCEWNPLGSDYYGIIGGSTARDDFTSRWEEFHKGFHGGAKCSLQEPRNNP